MKLRSGNATKDVEDVWWKKCEVLEIMENVSDLLWIDIKFRIFEQVKKYAQGPFKKKNIIRPEAKLYHLLLFLTAVDRKVLYFCYVILVGNG